MKKLARRLPPCWTVQTRSAVTTWADQLVLVIMLAVACLLRVHSLGRSLWLDEAWVANALLAPNLQQALYYPEWLQTTPPLFTTLGYIVARSFGSSEVSLRLLPLLTGLAIIPMIAWVGKRLFVRPYWLLAVLLVVFSPSLIVYSQSLKQFSTDVFAGMALLLAGEYYVRRRSGASFLVAVLSVSLLPLLSFQSVAYIPFLIYAALFDRREEADAASWHVAFQPVVRHLLVFVFAAGAVCTTVYFRFVKPNTSEVLFKYWASGFYDGASPIGWLTFVIERLAELGWSLHVAFSDPVAVLIIITCGVGLGSLLFRGVKSEKTVLDRALLLTIPVLVTLALNYLRLLPMGHIRTYSHLMPILVLSFCYGLQRIVRAGSTAVEGLFPSLHLQQLARTGPYLLLTAAVVAGCVRLAIGGRPYVRIESPEDARQAVKWLSRTSKPDDVVYIHASMIEQYKYYSRRYPVNVRDLVAGSVGSPCCPREAGKFVRPEPDNRAASEASVLVLPRAEGRLRLLFTTRESHWRSLGRSDLVLFSNVLEQRGCRKVSAKRMTGVELVTYRCRVDHLPDGDGKLLIIRVPSVGWIHPMIGFSRIGGVKVISNSDEIPSWDREGPTRGASCGVSSITHTGVPRGSLCRLEERCLTSDS